MSKLRWIALITLSAILAALVTIGAYSTLIKGLEPRKRQLAAERIATLEATASVAEAWFASAASELSAESRHLRPWTSSGAQTLSARASLDEMLSRSLEIDDIAYVVDKRKFVVASSTNAAALVGSPRSADHVLSALGGNIAFSPITTDPIHRLDIIAIAVPLMDATGKPVAALIGTTHLSTAPDKVEDHPPPGSFVQAIAGTPVPPGARLFLVDAAGTEVQASPFHFQPASDEVRRAVHLEAEGSPRFEQFKGEGGTQVAAATKKLSSGWSITIIQDASDFYRDLEQPVRFATGAIGLMLVIALVGLWIMYARYRSAGQRADVVKRSLLALAGHELRTPIAVVRGYSQTLLRNWDRVPDEQRKGMIQTLYRHSRSLEHLIERLLTGAQMDAGINSGANIRNADIAPMLADAVEQQQALTPLHEISLEAQPPLMAEVDAKSFDLAFNHLIENAVKFSPEGGHIWVTAVQQGNKVRITVEDEGVGLPADISGIFDRFSQSEDVDTRIYEEGGLGLGLFITKTHIVRMGGSIVAEKREPKGARFVVTLKGASG